METFVRWVRTNPVRTYLYGVLGVVVVALVFYGVITEAEAALWLIVAGTVLGVPVAVEAARSHVVPLDRHRALMRNHAQGATTPPEFKKEQ